LAGRGSRQLTRGKHGDKVRKQKTRKPPGGFRESGRSKRDHEKEKIREGGTGGVGRSEEALDTEKKQSMRLIERKSVGKVKSSEKRKDSRGGGTQKKKNSTARA